MAEEIYRIKKSNLKNDNLTLPVDFGLVYNDNGVITVDLYVNEGFDLDQTIAQNHPSIMNEEFILEGLTEEYDQIEIDRLSILRISYHLFKIKMVCYGKLTRIKKRFKHDLPEEEKEWLILYLFAEGLKMQFSDQTNNVKTRNGKVLKEFSDLQFDHTAVLLQVGKFPVNQIFYKDPRSDNIIIEFKFEIWNKISYSMYEELKRDYVSALSLVNGAQVKIRKELTGTYFSESLDKGIGAEVEISYSFNTIKNIRQSNYLPVGDPFHKGSKILSHFFLNNFQNFRQWNKILDFNTIISFLSTAQQVNTVEGKFFIQMIAFEKLSSLYADHLGEGTNFNPIPEKFAPIRDELFKVLEKYKGEFGKSFLNAKSNIGNLHLVRGLDTKQKMYRILQDFEIPIGEKTQEIVNKVRNSAIHRGSIADEWADSYIYLSLLDEILRELILKIIGYEGVRKKNYIGK